MLDIENYVKNQKFRHPQLGAKTKSQKALTPFD